MRNLMWRSSGAGDARLGPVFTCKSRKRCKRCKNGAKAPKKLKGARARPESAAAVTARCVEARSSAPLIPLPVASSSLPRALPCPEHRQVRSAAAVQRTSMSQGLRLESSSTSNPYSSKQAPGCGTQAFT